MTFGWLARGTCLAMSVSPRLRICIGMYTKLFCFVFTQFVKRDTILEIEKEVQLRWEREHVFEIDAPEVNSSVMYVIFV